MLTIDYEKEIYDMRQLLEISRALNSTLNSDYLISAVLDMSLAHAGTTDAGLFLTPNTEAGYLALARGFHTLSEDQYRYFAEIRIPLRSLLIRRLAEFPHAYSPEDLPEAPEIEGFKEALIRNSVSLIVPVTARNDVTGLILLKQKIFSSYYTESEKNFLTDLAGFAGIAVNNARLFEMATTDPLTGLKNRGFLQSRLKEETEKCLHSGQPLSVVITDIDHFKKFNDEHGHQAGDFVLQSTASVLSESASQYPRSFAARFGGEEFFLVLPGADPLQAASVAETVRKSVEESRPVFEGKQFQVTVSAGVSSVNPAGGAFLSPGDLIRMADEALYLSKRNGRNRVTSYRSGG